MPSRAGAVGSASRCREPGASWPARPPAWRPCLPRRWPRAYGRGARGGGPHCAPRRRCRPRPRRTATRVHRGRTGPPGCHAPGPPADARVRRRGTAGATSIPSTRLSRSTPTPARSAARSSSVFARMTSKPAPCAVSAIARTACEKKASWMSDTTRPRVRVLPEWIRARGCSVGTGVRQRPQNSVACARARRPISSELRVRRSPGTHRPLGRHHRGWGARAGTVVEPIPLLRYPSPIRCRCATEPASQLLAESPRTGPG